MRTLSNPLVWVALWLAATVVPALGQGRWGHDDRAMTPEEAQQRLQRSEAMLQELDTNRDGVLDANDVSGRSKFFVERILQRASVEPNYPILISKVREGLARAYQVPASSTNPPPSVPAIPGTPSSSPPAAPLVPGFGVASTLPLPGDFGLAAAVSASGAASAPATSVPATSVPATSVSATTAPATSAVPHESSSSRPAVASTGTTQEASKPSDDQRYRDYAKGLLAKYDKNKNGVLEKDECAEMSNNPKDADLNGDGVVSLDELTTWLMEQGRKGSGGRGSRSDSSRSDSSRSDGRGRSRSSDSATDRPRSTESAGDRPRSTDSAGDRSRSEGDKKRSAYHLHTERERLPAGLPDWFLRKDNDKDGQILMSEYANEWSDATAAEFARYDLNHDGVITAAECLKVEKTGKK